MRLVTYNIRGGLGMDGVRSTRRIAAVLRDIEADIICLQEVHQRLPWSRFRDQPGQLSRCLRKPVVFQSNYNVGIGGFGNAILTALPMFAPFSHCIPNARERRSVLRRPEKRGLLGIRLQTNEGPLSILTTHWSLDAQDRIEGAEVVANRVKDMSGQAILCGDFNALPDSPELALLRAETGLDDSGAADGRLTFPSDTPVERIDYVLVSPNIHISRYDVLESLASDHRPVVVEW